MNVLQDPLCAAVLVQHVLNAPNPNLLGNAGRCRKRSRIIEDFALRGGNVDSQEVGAAVLEENAAVAAAGGLPAGAPAWAAPLFASLATLTNTVNNHQINQTIAMAALTNTLTNVAARVHNSVADDADDPLESLVAAGGVVVANFPAARRDVDQLTLVQLRTLMQNMNQPHGGGLVALRQKFKRYIGIQH